MQQIDANQIFIHEELRNSIHSKMLELTNVKGGNEYDKIASWINNHISENKGVLKPEWGRIGRSATPYRTAMKFENSFRNKNVNYQYLDFLCFLCFDGKTLIDCWEDKQNRQGEILYSVSVPHQYRNNFRKVLERIQQADTRTKKDSVKEDVIEPVPEIIENTFDDASANQNKKETESRQRNSRDINYSLGVPVVEYKENTLLTKLYQRIKEKVLGNRIPYSLNCSIELVTPNIYSFSRIRVTSEGSAEIHAVNCWFKFDISNSSKEPTTLYGVYYGEVGLKEKGLIYVPIKTLSIAEDEISLGERQPLPTTVQGNSKISFYAFLEVEIIKDLRKPLFELYDNRIRSMSSFATALATVRPYHGFKEHWDKSLNKKFVKETFGLVQSLKHDPQVELTLPLKEGEVILSYSDLLGVLPQNFQLDLYKFFNDSVRWENILSQRMPKRVLFRFHFENRIIKQVVFTRAASVFWFFTQTLEVLEKKNEIILTERQIEEAEITKLTEGQRYEEAFVKVESYNKKYGLDRTPSHHCCLGELKRMTGDYKSALGYFQIADRLESNQFEIIYPLALTLINMGRHKEATDKLEQYKFLEKDYNDVSRIALLNLLVGCYFLSGNSLKQIEKLVEVEQILIGDNPEFRLHKMGNIANLIRCYLETNQYEKIEKYLSVEQEIYNSQTELLKEEVLVFYFLGVYYSKIKRHEFAIQLYNSYIVLIGNFEMGKSERSLWLQSKINSAVCYDLIGLPKKGIQILIDTVNSCEKEKDSLAILHHALALFYDRSDRKDETIMHIKKALTYGETAFGKKHTHYKKFLNDHSYINTKYKVQ
ncbi:hypothetical protein CJD36_004515 [Flavipsychrobacter stenotrophus]|uniref:Uncharacterized protein n=1 Tax=Flavipsychrobacter stenotrophus TaxID=2077091 RepID=A0A2S7T1C2_9BACT|nr:tetratricopeptide repeat protein [Flavipsychrobacter stenotrophus]PQJ13012.1 hypothetical protein CJD36_004515 [Flavipsychrobacter stenotrophus]